MLETRKQTDTVTITEDFAQFAETFKFSVDILKDSMSPQTRRRVPAPPRFIERLKHAPELVIIKHAF